MKIIFGGEKTRMGFFDFWNMEKKFHVYSFNELFATQGYVDDKSVRAIDAQGGSSREVCLKSIEDFGSPFDTNGALYAFEDAQIGGFYAIISPQRTTLFRHLMDAKKMQDNLFYVWNTPSRLCVGNASKKPFDMSNASLENRRQILSPERDFINALFRIRKAFPDYYDILEHLSYKVYRPIAVRKG